MISGYTRLNSLEVKNEMMKTIFSNLHQQKAWDIQKKRKSHPNDLSIIRIRNIYQYYKFCEYLDNYRIKWRAVPKLVKFMRYASCTMLWPFLPLNIHVVDVSNKSRFSRSSIYELIYIILTAYFLCFVVDLINISHIAASLLQFTKFLA